MFGAEKEKRLQEQNRIRSLQQWNVHQHPMAEFGQTSAAPTLSSPLEPVWDWSTSVKRETFPSMTQEVHEHSSASQFPALTSPFTRIDPAPLEFQSYDPLLHPANFYSQSSGMVENSLQSASFERIFGAAVETCTPPGDAILIQQIHRLLSELCPCLSDEEISRYIKELQIENRERSQLNINSSSIGRGDGMSFYDLN